MSPLAYAPDLDHLLRRRPEQEVHQPELRHPLRPRWPTRCRRSHVRLCRDARYGDTEWEKPVIKAPGCSRCPYPRSRLISHGTPLVLHTQGFVPFVNEGMYISTIRLPMLTRQYIQESEQSTQAMPAFYLLGLLANYNKFEFQNPYRLRLDDFVNDRIIQKIIASFGHTCTQVRDTYVAVQDDMPEGWTLGSTLNYIGLGVLAPASRPKTPVLGPEETKALFAAL